MMNPALFAIVLSASVLAADAAIAAPPHDVTVVGTRVRIGDVVPEVDATTAAVDIGPSPAPGGSRLITRADIALALGAKQMPVPATLPQAIRVIRKAKHLAPPEVDAIVSHALEAKGMPRGVLLNAVRADHPVDIADGWVRVEVEVPRAPKREGTFATSVLTSFFAADGEPIARITVPIELGISADGAFYDAARGAAVTLIVRRNYIEVRAAGVTTADADIGDQVPVQLRQSGRVLRAHLVSRDEAVAIEDGQ